MHLVRCCVLYLVSPLFTSGQHCPVVDQITERAESYPCNIRRIYNDDLFSRGILDTRILPDEPLIFVRSRETNRVLSDFARAEHLLATYGSSVVELRSSNSYSSGIRRVTLADYIHGLLASGEPGHSLANETYYLFGGNTGELWDEIERLYALPGCKHCGSAGAVIPGLGGNLSGVSFHFHGPGFSEVILGAKRWFLYPPVPSSTKHQEAVPGFNPDMTVAQWVSDVHSTFDENPSLKPLECVITSGEVLYFPDRWMHATLNTETYVFFVSTFLDPQLILD